MIERHKFENFFLKKDSGRFF